MYIQEIRLRNGGIKSVEVWKWISDFAPHFTDLIACECCD